MGTDAVKRRHSKEQEKHMFEAVEVVKLRRGLLSAVAIAALVVLGCGGSSGQGGGTAGGGSTASGGGAAGGGGMGGGPYGGDTPGSEAHALVQAGAGRVSRLTQRSGALLLCTGRSWGCRKRPRLQLHWRLPVGLAHLQHRHTRRSGGPGAPPISSSSSVATERPRPRTRAGPSTTSRGTTRVATPTVTTSAIPVQLTCGS